MPVLRAVADADLSCLAALRGDTALQHLLMANPDPVPPPDLAAATRAWVERRQATGAFHVVADGHGDAQGFVQLSDIHFRNRTGWLGLALHPRARGQGLGIAALTAAEVRARADLGLRKLLLQARADNAVALALYRKAGWRQVGLMQAHYDDGVAFHDVLLFEKLLLLP